MRRVKPKKSGVQGSEGKEAQKTAQSKQSKKGSKVSLTRQTEPAKKAAPVTSAKPMTPAQAARTTVLCFLVALALFSSASLVRSSAQKEEKWENPYVDVMQNMWSYQYITELNRLGVFLDQRNFAPDQVESRGNLAVHLYNMDQTVFAQQKEEREKAQEKLRKETKAAPPSLPAFTDVEPESQQYAAICWVYQNGIMSGTGDNVFAPEANLTREQVCTILARFGALEEVQLAKVVQPNQFVDSLEIDQFARSGVTACQMAAIVKGDGEGFFNPLNTMSRQEVAAVLYRLMTAAQNEVPEHVETVDLTPGAYDRLYDSYTPPKFEPLVPISQAEAPLDYFAKTVFIGDSVSLTLESYCNATQALGEAQFLCAGSMSATNILAGQILPEYPKGSGQTPPIWDSVAQCGAQVVYIMLGMDNIAYGIDKSTGDMLTVIQKIQEAAPDVTIVIQSVTPMAENSKSFSAKLNNDTIDAYNARMLEYCDEHQWYYVNVQEVFKDEDGFLKPEYCSDLGKMGMHFTYEGAKIWVQYLKDHVPEDLL